MRGLAHQTGRLTFQEGVMARLRRFFYVASPRGASAHMMFGRSHSEGLTACGRVVSADRRWFWMKHGRGGLPRCLDCERVVDAR